MTVPTKASTSRIIRDGQGPPLVYLHGAGGLQPGDPLVSALAESFEVIAPIAPGFDNPDDLDDIRDVHELAFHYDALLDGLGFDGATVVGHSFGAMAAAELAAHVPQRVARLVLIAPIGVWNDAYPVADLFATPLAELDDLLWGDPAAPVAQLVSAMMASVDPVRSDHFDANIDMLVNVVQGMSATAKFLWPIPDKGLVRRLHRIRADTLLIWGALDRLVPVRYADDFGHGIPHAQRHVLTGAGHMVPFERPYEVAALIRNWLTFAADVAPLPLITVTHADGEHPVRDDQGDQR